MQESAKNVIILNAMSTDHSLLFCSFLNLTDISRGRGLWKFSNSLISNTNFVDEMKKPIHIGCPHTVYNKMKFLQPKKIFGIHIENIKFSV